MNDELEGALAAQLQTLGYELVELRLGGSRARPTLQLRIDRLDGGAVTVDDCATVSRALQATLDREERLGDRYVLEVSSPGVERPLRKAADWQRFVGRRASVVSPALHGREEVDILAVEGEPGAESVRVRTPRGDEQRIALAEVKEARLAFNW